MTDTEKENTNEQEDNVTDVTDVTSPETGTSKVTAEATSDIGDVTNSAAEQFEGNDDIGDKQETIASVPLDKRPCYEVYDDWAYLDDGQKLRPGVYLHTIKHVAGGENQPIDKWICSPLYIDAVTHDKNDNNFGRLLRFLNTNGKWCYWAMPMEMLRGSGEELRGELFSKGVLFDPDPRGRNGFTKYLQFKLPPKRITCALETGWYGDCFVLPDTVIGPSSGQIIYQNAGSVQEEYEQSGTLDSWKQEIAMLAIGNPMLMFGVSVGFSGPLLKLLNAESGGMHLVGDSSCGKTTILEAASSIWGSATYRRSWSSTANGMEGVAALYNDNLLALDEISECDPRDVGKIVYALGNGRGKQRANRSGGAKSIRHWRCAVISSGERTIRTTMAEGGMRPKAGQEIRMLDVPVMRQFGCWDDLCGRKNGAILSDAIKDAAITHYGRAGRAFLECLTHDQQSFSSRLDEIKGLPEFSCPNSEGQHKRAAKRFAIVALAGEIATEYGITGWPKGAAIGAAAIAFQAWKSQRGRGNDERRQILEQLSSFIEQHGDSRFSNHKSGDTDKTRDRAGWWRQEDDGTRTYLFNTAAMNEALSGHDLKRALDILEEAEIIPPANAKGERAKPMKIPGHGSSRLYEVGYEKLQTSIRNNAGYVSIDTAVTTETQSH